MTEYQQAPDMFAVPEFEKTGFAYVVRTAGFRRSDPDSYWVCVGGQKGRPHSGPFASPAEAEAIKIRFNGEAL